jgi:hypothetical protein
MKRSQENRRAPRRSILEKRTKGRSVLFAGEGLGDGGRPTALPRHAKFLALEGKFPSEALATLPAETRT